jgi:hypothetical protein
MTLNVAFQGGHAGISGKNAGKNACSTKAH